MCSFTMLLPLFVGLTPAQPVVTPPGEQTPKLSFTQEGKDLVVSMTVEVQDVPHALWTRAELVMDHDPYLLGPRRPPKLSRVELSYHIIQCRDDPVHRWVGKTKKVEVKWRIVDHQQSGVPYRVIKQFNPSAVELKALAPQLTKVAEETERRTLKFTP